VYLNEANCTKCKARNVNYDPNWKKLRETVPVSFTVDGVDKLRELDHLAPSIKKLVIKIDIDDPSCLKPVAQMREIKIQGSKVNRIDYLNELKGIQLLTISETNIREITTLEKMPILKDLRIGSNKSLAYLGDSLSSNTLEYFNIGESRLQPCPTFNTPKLRAFGYNWGDIVDLDGLLSKVHAPMLEVFTGDHNLISKISGLSQFPHLTFLSLSSNRITRIEGLDNLYNLKEVHFEGNPIADIAGLLHLTKLRRIFMNHSAIKKLPKNFYTTCELHSEKGIEKIN